MLNTTEPFSPEQPKEVITSGQDKQLSPIEQENIRDIKALKEKYPDAVQSVDEESIRINFTGMNENINILFSVYGFGRSDYLAKASISDKRKELLKSDGEYDEMRWLLIGKESKVSKEFLPYGVALLNGNQGLTISRQKGVEVMGGYRDLGEGKPLREIIKTEEDQKAFDQIMGFVDKYNRLVREDKEDVNRQFGREVWSV